MGLVVVTPPAGDPISVAEAKLNLRLQTTQEDSRVAALVRAATAAIEHRCGALVQRTVRLELEGFPPVGRRLGSSDFDCRVELNRRLRPERAIKLPRPVLSVASISYYDEAGGNVVLAGSEYLVDKAEARIHEAPGKAWPATQDRYDSVRVLLDVGFGEPPAVPDVLRQAVHALVVLWYEERAPVVTGTIATEIPRTLEAMIEPYTMIEVG